MSENKEDLELRRVKLIEEDGTIVGDLTAVSFVTEPAIELKTKFFSKEKRFEFKVSSTERMEITGPALIPDTAILRYDEELKKHYNAIFTKEDVKAASEIFLRKANHNQANFEHQPEFTDKLALVESWIVISQENDKAKELGFNMSEIPLGSWFMTYKVLDEALWNELKESDYEGFSVELKGFEVPAESFSKIDETEIKSVIKSIAFSSEMCDVMKEKLIKKLLAEIENSVSLNANSVQK